MDTVNIEGQDYPVWYVHIISKNPKGQSSYQVTVAYASTHRIKGIARSIYEWINPTPASGIPEPIREHATLEKRLVLNQKTKQMEIQTVYMGISCYSKNEKKRFTKKEGRKRSSDRLKLFVGLCEDIHTINVR
jgi:hypothetical protein